MIDLSAATPIDAGSRRDIYHHPDDDGLVIKVYSDRRQAKQKARNQWERLTKPRYEAEFIREIKAVYRASLLRQGTERLPIISSAGLVQTSKGLGLTVEKIAGPDGNLAPKLHKFIGRDDFETAFLPQLNRFAADLFRFRIIGHDLNGSNIVYFEAEDRFIAIDGFGSRTLIPIMVWSRLANERQLNRTLKKLIGDRTRLIWNKAARRFEL